MSSNTEQMIIEYESARNQAMGEYFAARPQISRTREKECLFEAGFRMAYEWKNLKLPGLKEQDNDDK